MDGLERPLALGTRLAAQGDLSEVLAGPGELWEGTSPPALDELLHVAMGFPGALAPHGEPAVGVLVVGIVLALLARVVDRRLRSDLTGAKVDPPAALDRVALEEAGRLLEVNGKRAQHGCGPTVERRVELVGEIVVAFPCALSQLPGGAPGELGGARHALGQQDDRPVTRELRQLGPARLRQCDDGTLAVRTEDGASKSDPAVVDPAHPRQPGASRSWRRRQVCQWGLSSPVAAPGCS